MLSSAPTRAPQMKPPQVLGGSCPGSSSCTAAPQVTDPNKNQSCSSNPSTGDNSDPAGGHLLLQALMTLGSREEGGSPIRMQGNVRGSLQPLSREQSLDPIRDFPANTTSWRRGGFALVKQQKPRGGSHGAETQLSRDFPGGRLREKQSSLCAHPHPPAPANRAAPSDQHQTSHTETHTSGTSKKQQWVNYGLAKAIFKLLL